MIGDMVTGVRFFLVVLARDGICFSFGNGGTLVNIVYTVEVAGKYNNTNTGWLFGTCLFFPYIGNNHPN